MVKRKTPRMGKPPPGYIRVVMDYPISADLGLTWDIEHGHRLGHAGNTALAPWGRLIRYIVRTEDAPGTVSG